MNQFKKHLMVASLIGLSACGNSGKLSENQDLLNLNVNQLVSKDAKVGQSSKSIEEFSSYSFSKVKADGTTENCSFSRDQVEKVITHIEGKKLFILENHTLLKRDEGSEDICGKNFTYSKFTTTTVEETLALFKESRKTFQDQCIADCFFEQKLENGKIRINSSGTTKMDEANIYIEVSAIINNTTPWLEEYEKFDATIFDKKGGNKIQKIKGQANFANLEVSVKEQDSYFKTLAGRTFKNEADALDELKFIEIKQGLKFYAHQYSQSTKDDQGKDVSCQLRESETLEKIFTVNREGKSTNFGFTTVEKEFDYDLMSEHERDICERKINISKKLGAVKIKLENSNDLKFEKSNLKPSRYKKQPI